MKRILITGAGARIGQAIAIKLAEHGFCPIIHYNRSAKAAKAAKAAIEQAGGQAELIQGDLSDTKCALDLIPALSKRGGPLCGLINNASMFEPDTLTDFTAEQWDQHFAINTKAPILLAQAFAAHLPKGETGHIINLLDQRLSKLNPTFFSYTLSKSALATATITMAQALAPHIQVNAIAPGPTMQNARQSDTDFADQKRASLLGNGSPPDEITRAVLFLLQASAITGQTLTVDGGQHLIWQSTNGKGSAE